MASSTLHEMEQPQPGRSRVLEELDLLQKPLDPAPANRRNANSYWKWKLLGFLDGIRRRRVHCVICIQVHQIDGLPPAMDSRVLVVSWKTKGCKGEHTLPVHACQGVASFDEIFLHYCSSDVQTTLKSFTIWASLVDAADCDLGTFHVDLSELAAAEYSNNSGFGGKTMSFVLGGLATGGALRLSVYCRTMEEEGHDLIGKSKGKKMSKCFSCLPDLGCLRTSPVTFCARRIPSLRSDHGFITIENSPPPPATDVEDGGFITIEKGRTDSSRPRRPPSDYLANTDDDESGTAPEDEKPCLVIEQEEEDEDDDDGDGIEDEFLRMMEEKCYCKSKDGDEAKAGKKKTEGGVRRSLSLDMDLESLVKESEMELAKAMQVWRSRAAAALMDQEEYEELMRRWVSSSSSSSGWHGIHGFGSPV